MAIIFAAVDDEDEEVVESGGGGSDVISLLKKKHAGKEGRRTQSMDIRKVLHGQQVKGICRVNFHVIFISYIHMGHYYHILPHHDATYSTYKPVQSSHMQLD